MLQLLEEAAKIAISDVNGSLRKNFLHGGIGVRKDGVLVSARNGAVNASSSAEFYKTILEAHCEPRIVRKMGKGGGEELYIARVLRKDQKTFAMSAPCAGCSNIIRAAKIPRVYYSISNYQYGIWLVEEDKHIICDC